MINYLKTEDDYIHSLMTRPIYKVGLPLVKINFLAKLKFFVLSFTTGTKSYDSKSNTF